MEITQLGNNTVTYCSHCDELLSVKGNYDTEALDRVVDLHRENRTDCRKHYDSLPTLEETLAAIRQVETDKHATHTCTPAKCACICGCDVELACTLGGWGGPLCSDCALRVIREDEEHGEK